VNSFTPPPGFGSAAGRTTRRRQAAGPIPTRESTMNTGFSDALVRRIDGRQHAFHTSTGTLYLPYEVVHCMPSDDGWTEDPSRPAEPTPFASEGTPVVPLVSPGPPKTRLRVVPVPGDQADFLLVLDRADEGTREALAPVPFGDGPPLLVRDRFTGCAGVLVFSDEVEVE
jgi:hypothetical protein